MTDQMQTEDNGAGVQNSNFGQEGTLMLRDANTAPSDIAPFQGHAINTGNSGAFGSSVTIAGGNAESSRYLQDSRHGSNPQSGQQSQEQIEYFNNFTSNNGPFNNQQQLQFGNGDEEGYEALNGDEERNEPRNEERNEPRNEERNEPRNGSEKMDLSKSDEQECPTPPLRQRISEVPSTPPVPRRNVKLIKDRGQGFGRRRNTPVTVTPATESFQRPIAKDQNGVPLRVPPRTNFPPATPWQQELLEMVVAKPVHEVIKVLGYHDCFQKCKYTGPKGKCKEFVLEQTAGGLCKKHDLVVRRLLGRDSPSVEKRNLERNLETMHLRILAANADDTPLPGQTFNGEGGEFMLMRVEEDQAFLVNVNNPRHEVQVAIDMLRGNRVADDC